MSTIVWIFMLLGAACIGFFAAALCAASRSSDLKAEISQLMISNEKLKAENEILKTKLNKVEKFLAQNSSENQNERI